MRRERRGSDVLTLAFLLLCAAPLQNARAAEAASVTAARQPLATWPGPTAAVKPPAGKSIMVVTCSSQGIGCVRSAQGVKAAGTALGWTVRIVDGRGDPGAWNGAILSAIAAKSDGIVLAAVPPMLVGDALARAKDAHVPVVSVFNPKPGQDDGIFAFVRPDHVAQGKLAADWVAGDSGGKAQVLVVEDREFAELNQRVDGFREGLKACADCVIVGTVESTIGTMAQRLPGAIASALSRYPKATYIVAPFDSNAFFVEEGVRQAGRSEAVKVTGYEGDPQALDGIRTGSQAMTIANPAEWMGWQAVDELARAFTNAAPANVPTPYRLLDKQNVPKTAGWQGDMDYAARFDTLWGIK